MNPVKSADLHLHTVFSDGTYTPEELVEQSIKAGLSAIAVVDHDTVAGIGPVMEAAKGADLEILSGVELTAEHAGSEVHILGYLIDHQDKALLERLEILKENRRQRVYKILEKLKGMGMELDPQAVFSLAKKGTVGRLHIARAMVAQGLATSIPEAFYRHIGDNRPAYVLGFRFSPRQAIELIKSAGGIPVLAHPYSIDDDSAITEFIKEGIMGLEVYYPEHTQGMINFYLGLAKEHNLLLTGGSDCHGGAKPQVLIGSVKIPYELVEKLKQAKDRLR
ncbi:MAG: PHP domain-containing protein [Candidatus Pacebacteria bacterium]|nr:PHP domain-containing protein [Candidatus Paceibacterota bacterium]